jgi:hypothetical protein
VIGIFSDMVNNCMEIFTDKFTPYGTDFEESLSNLEKVLKICRQSHLSLSTENFHMMMREGVVLGHFIFHAGIQVDPAKIQVILDIPTPSTQKEVRSFLGHAGYYRRFIKNFSKLASPLFFLLTKDFDFRWIDNCELSFADLKEKLFTAPILRGPNWDLPFYISSYTSNTAIGAVLGK